MTLQQLISELTHSLAPKYGEGEASALVRILFERLKGWDNVQLAIRRPDEVTQITEENARNVVARLLADEPIQYIFGVARFYGMDFKVTPATLIPRPETATLVDFIVDENPRSDLRVLDLGTGSGCIAIALARHLPFAQVTATDLSPEALAVARENAKALGVKVDFVLDDMLNSSLDIPEGSLDIVVSNPPYIAASEARMMDANVLEHEPHAALFVPDDDPLLFYRAVATIARRLLKPGVGRLYLEINPLFVDPLKTLLRAEGFTDIETARDMQSRLRFATATLP